MISPPSYSLVSNRAMEGTRSNVLACWGTGRVRSAAPATVEILIYNATPLYSDSHNYRTLRASPSPFLTHLSLLLFPSLPLSLSRSHPILSFISSPCSATLVSNYQYRRRYTVCFFSLFVFLLFRPDFFICC